MKKKLLIRVLVIITLEFIAISGILLYLMSSSGSHSPESIENIDAYKERKLKQNSFYNIKADIEISKNVITLKEDINFKKASGRLLAYVPSANTAATRVKSVNSEKGVLGFTFNNTTLEIKCREAQSNVRVEYEISLNNNEGMLTYNDNFYYLTNFLITPVVNNGKGSVLSYKSPFGDPYIYEANNYYIMFKTDKSMHIYAPGTKEEHVFGSNKMTIFEASDIRDFPAVMANHADIEKIKYNDTDVYYINSKDSSEYVTEALKFSEKNIGPYPYKSLFVVRAPLSQKGMEFSNMIFISGKCFSDKEDLKRVTYHEVLHQWFYGIIGTDQLNEPFFDEGLVNYLSNYLSNPKELKSKFSNTVNTKFVNMPLSSYTSLEEYYNLAYNYSAAYFYNIHRKLGDNFYKLLKELYRNKKYKMLYFNEFEKYINNYRGK